MIRPKEIVDLRRSRRQRSLSVSELPSTPGIAYDIAAATVGYLGMPVGGWKLGATTAATRRAFATNEIYFGALLPDEIWRSTEDGRPPAPPVLRGEAEIALRVAVDIAPGDCEAFLTRPAADLFDAWAPVIEAPYSCFEDVATVGLRALLMDRCAAGALYVGEPRPNIGEPGMEQMLEIFADGVCVAKGTAKTSLLMTPVEAALGFLRIAAAQGAHLRSGQWISTGGITPCETLPFDCPIQLVFAGHKEFEIVLEVPKP